MNTSCTGIILAGGENRRFNGKNKAFAKINGQTIIDRISKIFRDLFDEVVLVTNDPVRYLDHDVSIVSDHFKARSSLNGLHAGLFAASNPYAFCVACDTPFIQKALVQYLIRQIERNKDIVIPRTGAGFEPFFAVYSKMCIKPIEYQLKNNRMKIQGLFSRTRVKKISEADLRNIDPELISFFNVNTPEDLVTAEKLFSETFTAE